MDNVFIEWPWKSAEYEDMYIKTYDSIATTKKELMRWFYRYNMRWRHQGPDNRTSDEVLGYVAQSEGYNVKRGRLTTEEQT